jgi:hypothetical protein
MQKDPAIKALAPFLINTNNTITPMQKKTHVYHQDVSKLIDTISDDGQTSRVINPHDEDFTEPGEAEPLNIDVTLQDITDNTLQEMDFLETGFNTEPPEQDLTLGPLDDSSDDD